MHKQFTKSLLLIGLTVSLVACQPAQPPASGPNLEPTIAPTLTFAVPTAIPPTAAAPTPTGSPVSDKDISFDIPPDVSPDTSASASRSISTEAEFPFIYPDDSKSEHVVFQFTNYPVRVPRDARIMVFKASDYAADYSEEVIAALSAGQDTLQPLPDSLAQGEFYAQDQAIRFKNGRGVRYLTQVLIDFGPINNEGLFYYYQGITADGAYFVSAIFPVNADFLPANGLQDAVTPTDGVPFDWQGSYLDFPPYLTAVTQKLNDTPDERYTPSLLTLDELIESIQVSEP
jgi:hypothetical protein